jgi:hypothetical protein
MDAQGYKLTGSLRVRNPVVFGWTQELFELPQLELVQSTAVGNCFA